MAKMLKSLRLDDRLVRSAQRILGAKSRTQTIEMSLEAVVETEDHRKLIKRYSGKARPAALTAANPDYMWLLDARVAKILFTGERLCSWR
jgi:hypothetical protein